jgi:hypothetical protein
MFSIVSFSVSIPDNLNLLQVGKEDPINFLKDAFPCKFHDIKIVPTSETEMKSIIIPPPIKKTHLDMMKQRVKF